MQILMGKVDGRSFDVDAEALRRSHLLVTGVSGSGKSYRLRCLAEALVKVMPVWLFDVEGEYFTLREKFPFMLFGENGDAPIAVETAALTARKVLEWKRSAIFDLSSLDVEHQHEWMRVFLNALMAAPRESWGPLACLIDEAHLWAPEKGEGFSEALTAMKNLCARGRKRGIFVVLATQRLSKLANNCASEMQNYLVGRTTLPADRDRAAKMLGVTSKSERDVFFHDIKTLRDHFFYGQGIAISPDRIKLAPIEAKTTHIRPGDIQAMVPAAPAEIQAFLPQLSTLAKEAKEEATTTEQLQRRVHELTAALASRGGGKPAAELQELRKRVATANEATEATLREAISCLGGIISYANCLIQDLQEGHHFDIKEMPLRYPKIVDAPAPGHTVNVPDPPMVEAIVTKNGFSIADDDGEGTDPKERYRLRLLRALRSAELSGIASLDRTWLAIVAAASPTSSSYRGAISLLERGGKITYPSVGYIALTPQGREAAGHAQPFSTPDLLDRLQKVFEPARYRILLTLVENGGEWIDRDALAAASSQSPTSSAYRSHMSDLRSLGLIELSKERSGLVRIDPFIFLRPAVTA